MNSIVLLQLLVGLFGSNKSAKLLLFLHCDSSTASADVFNVASNKNSEVTFLHLNSIDVNVTVNLILSAITRDTHLGIALDFDCDGATDLIYQVRIVRGF